MAASFVVFGFLSSSSSMHTEDSILQRNFIGELLQNIFTFFDQLFQSATSVISGTKSEPSTATTGSINANNNVQKLQIQAAQEPTLTRVTLIKIKILRQQQNTYILLIFLASNPYSHPKYSRATNTFDNFYKLYYNNYNNFFTRDRRY